MEIISLKLRQLDENYRGKYWHRLWIEVRPANLFFSDSSASLLTISLSHEQDNIADYMSRLDSVHYKVRSAVINGKVTSSKVFAKYGARDVETGPIQLLKSKLLRYLRPFNPDAEIRISQDPDSKEVSIVSCAPENAKKASKSKSKSKQSSSNSPVDDDSDSDDGGFVSVDCVTKWSGRFE